MNTKMATSFPGSLSYSSDKIENHNTRQSKIQISRALRMHAGMLKKYFKIYVVLIRFYFILLCIFISIFTVYRFYPS